MTTTPGSVGPPPITFGGEQIRTGLSVDEIRQAIFDNLFYLQGRHPARATCNDYYMALAYSVRDRLFNRFIETIDTIIRSQTKIVTYFSAEYLLGPQLAKNLLDLKLYQTVKQALATYEINIDDLIEHEREPGLGNGGLGRLAACYLDSLATLQIPAVGYGIRYEFGMFNQAIRNGWQVEAPDKWLSLGYPWEIARPESSIEVWFGGRTESYNDEQGRYRVRWRPGKVVKGIPYDQPIVGFNVNNCNILRLWRAEAVEELNFELFNEGDYYRAVEEKVASETITKVLYPNDDIIQGKQLRLEQQYFFASCSLQDMIRLHLAKNVPIEKLADTFAAQLNDTHPSIAIPELMRLLVDKYLMPWDKAWDITQRMFGFTNHTLLPEALEKWPVALFGTLLPRHLEIIYEINRRFLDEVRMKYPNDDARVARVSIIDETQGRSIRMANLACIGSHSVNGVAKLHTELLKRDIFPDFVAMWPNKFNNKTNGVTPRRFLNLCNPDLSELITEKIGANWITHLEDLKGLERFADDRDFQERWMKIKQKNKESFAGRIQKRTGIVVNPQSLFDVQVKRIHEYKRQLLNILHVINLYNRIKRNPSLAVTARTVIFGGKAAPGYRMAKLIIKLITSVGEVIDKDPDVRDWLRVVFYPNYNVKNGQHIYPAADLSEQISTAGKEASGTGNMKLALNGALTIGTYDGANIEIREAVGADNFFLFGLKAEEIVERRRKGYFPYEYYNTSQNLREVIDLILGGAFSHGNRDLFKPLIQSILDYDQFMVLADFQAYIDCQDKVSRAFQDKSHWAKMSILNVARMGYFSSDRAIREYCQDIWKVSPLPVAKENYLSEYAKPKRTL